MMTFWPLPPLKLCFYFTVKPSNRELGSTETDKAHFKKHIKKSPQQMRNSHLSRNRLKSHFELLCDSAEPEKSPRTQPRVIKQTCKEQIVPIRNQDEKTTNNQTLNF